MRRTTRGPARRSSPRSLARSRRARQSALRRMGASRRCTTVTAAVLAPCRRRSATARWSGLATTTTHPTVARRATRTTSRPWSQSATSSCPSTCPRCRSRTAHGPARIARRPSAATMWSATSTSATASRTRATRRPTTSLAAASAPSHRRTGRALGSAVAASTVRSRPRAMQWHCTGPPCTASQPSRGRRQHQSLSGVPRQSLRTTSRQTASV
mmetsp:Transcript_65068/g.167486  ORF Transcript_65068/g.167486 Transcript_65068/m.167486 type:complete len:213 (-) Transcript_65068:69-707(-)